MSNPLNNANEDAPVKLPIEQAAQAHRTIQKLTHGLAVLSTILSEDKLMKSDIQTHMSLLRYGYDDLSKILDNGETLSKELTETQAMCCAANQKCRELETRLGQNITAEDISAGLRRLISTFEAWYNLAGFRYAKIEPTQYNCLMCDFSSTIEHPDTRDEQQHSDPYREVLKGRVPYAFANNETGKFDLQKDTFCDELLDTDNNKALLTALFKTWFPNSKIYGYKVRADREKYHLELQVRIEYKDIDALIPDQNNEQEEFNNA